MLIPMYITVSDGDSKSLTPLSASALHSRPSVPIMESQVSRGISDRMSISPFKNISHCVLWSSMTRYRTSSNAGGADWLRRRNVIVWFLRQRSSLYGPVPSPSLPMAANGAIVISQGK